MGVEAGYRWLDIDYESDDGNERFVYDVLTQGRGTSRRQPNGEPMTRKTSGSVLAAAVLALDEGTSAVRPYVPRDTAAGLRAR